MARGRNTEESTPAEQPNLFVVINTDIEDFLGAYPNEDKAIARAKDYVDNDTPEVVIARIIKKVVIPTAHAIVEDVE